MKCRCAFVLVSSLLSLWYPCPPAAAALAADEIAAARALFEANLEAIRKQDREAYLACYWQSERLVRGGPEGVSLGFGELAGQAGESWPDRFDAQDLRLVHLRPGLVYGSYRYRVRYGEDEERGRSERLFLKTPEGWRIAVTTAFALPSAPPPRRALVGATLVDGTGGSPVADSVVLLAGGRIECAGGRRECPVPDGVEVVDVGGHWITPGLVDAHVHFSQTAWADGRPDSLDVRPRYPYEEVQAALRRNPERWFRPYLCSGVTAVFDVGGYPWTWELRQRVEGRSDAPHIAAAGPLLSTLDFWLNLPAERQFMYLADPAAAEAGVRYLASHGTDAVKVWFLAVRQRTVEEMDAAVIAAGEEAARLGVPLIVHATELREAKVALRAGAHLLVHSVWDQPVDQEFIDLALEHGTLYNPTLTVREGYRRMYLAATSDTPPELDDPNSCVDGESVAKLAATRRVVEELGLRVPDPATLALRLEGEGRIGAENLKRLHAAGVPIAMGTDAGNPLTFPGPSVYAEMEAMQAAGLTPMDVLVASTLGGARAMRADDRIGSVRAGKVADLLIVAADPVLDIRNLRQLRFVVRGGELRPIEELKAP